MSEEQPKLLLFVEDEPDIAGLYRFTFEKHGFEVDAANTGGDAIKKVIQYVQNGGELPSVMVFDILLPDKISGMDILKEVRLHPPERDQCRDRTRRCQHRAVVVLG